MAAFIGTCFQLSEIISKYFFYQTVTWTKFNSLSDAATLARLRVRVLPDFHGSTMVGSPCAKPAPLHTTPSTAQRYQTKPAIAAPCGGVGA
jgi:hypothetical protein